MSRGQFLISAVAILAAIYSASSNAQSGHRVQIIGFGADSCGAFVEARRQAEANDLASQMKAIGMTAWVDGFISAAAAFSEPINRGLQRTDSEGILAWVDNYCDAHPLETLAHAADALAAEVRKQ